MDVTLQKLFEENGHCLFFQFSFVFSALHVEKIKDNLIMLWCLAFDFSLKRKGKESVLKIRVNLIFCNVLKSFFWLVSGPMEKLMMASAFNNLTDFLLPYHICPFVFFSPNKPEDCTNFSQQQFIIVNQHFLPTFLPVTCWFDSWLIGIWNFFVTSSDIGFQLILAPLFQLQQP